MINKASKKKKLIKKGLIVVISALLVVLSIAGISSFSNLDKVNNSNQNNSDNSNKKLAIYLENDSGEYELSSDRKFPKKCYVLDTEKTTCKNGGTITQDPTTKSINGSFSKADSCNLYFKKETAQELSPTSLTSQLISKSNPVSVTDYNSGTKTEMYTFEHPATEQTGALTDYRYIGNTPNNYITFNDETWRVLGVFTNEDECGNKTQNIKIIRDASLGNMYWDTKSDGTYTNEWPTSSLSTMLNGDYINKGSSFDYTWYNSSGTTNTTTINGLNSTAQNQISSVKWYLGGNDTSQNIGGPDYYSFERGATIYSGNSTNVIAKVGLMYPSDYVYTYALGVDNTCYSNGYNCYTSKGGTPSSGWLFNSYYQWTITPRSSSAEYAFYVNYAGSMTSSRVKGFDGVRPVVFLDSNIQLMSGDGSSGSPYEISIPYTVIYQNWDSSPLQVYKNQKYGVIPDYTGSVPVRPSDGRYTYMFRSWSNKIEKENTIIFTAQYTPLAITPEGPDVPDAPAPTPTPTP